jgi:hypothetical protein
MAAELVELASVVAEAVGVALSEVASSESEPEDSAEAPDTGAESGSGNGGVSGAGSALEQAVIIVRRINDAKSFFIVCASPSH